MKGDKNLLQIIKTGYYADLEKDNFSLFGLKVYLGKMGSGKTLSVVREVHDLVQLNPDIAVVSNLKLNFKAKYMYYFDSMNDFFLAYVSCLKNDRPSGIIVVIDEIQLFIEKLIQTKNLKLLTILSQSRKLHTYILGTSQLYNKIDKDIRDYIRTNGQIVFCSKILRFVTIHKYVHMEDCSEDSRLNLRYRISRFDWFVHTRDLFALYDTFDIISPVLDLLNTNN